LKELGRILVLLLMFLPSLWTSGQLPLPSNEKKLSNLRQRKLPVADTMVLDTSSIIPKTLSIAGVSDTDYHLDFVKAILYWNKKPSVDSIVISYRVFPFKLNPVAQHLNYDSISKIPFVIPLTFNNNNQYGSSKGMFDFGNLNTTGSFGRQISFGNSQDAVLNSTLNLQMQGMLGDSIEIHAAITDNNIPIQPEGNTQQLNEFDQVFLQFKKRNWQLNLGDIDIRQKQSYFLSFYKRLEGISFETNNRISKSVISNTLVSGSIAKGKFTRNVFQGLEGNQGPYRLTGANNEFFFIVLANTERVFLDGELLQRGEDQDYVINYNTAEVSFTPKRMITKDSRIQVEFEYSDRNYLNANLYLSQDFVINNKLKLHIGAFNNSDAKNSQINQTLDANQKLFLTNLGDSIQNAFYPNAALDTFAAGKILYQKLYYNTGTGVDSFYQYSTNPDSARYNLSFVNVGQGKGNYVPDFNGANGKVYRFIAPINGVKQGSYESALILVTPKKQQLVNLGIDYAITKNTSLVTEVAMSNYDVNTFSKKDNGDDAGYAAKILLNSVKPLRSKKELKLITGLDYEYVQDKFKPLERLRQVEFSRDWGLPLVLSSATENIIKAFAQLKNKNNNSIAYQVTDYNRSDNYNGVQNSILHSLNLKGWRFNNQFVITNFKTFNTKGYFFRPIFDMSKELNKVWGVRLGFRYALEKNQTKNKETDSLTFNSFSFDTYSVYLQSNQKRKNKYGVTFFTRSDKYPLGKELARGDRSYNINLQTELISNEHHQFLLNATYRKLKVLNSSLTPQKDDNTILGRAEYVVNEWKGLLTGNLLYEVGAGQEQKRDFAYIEVPAGTGQYAWIDYNNDNVQQLNEFESAAFPDQAKFIRIFTPTNEFVKANYNTFNYSVSLNPRAAMNLSQVKGFSKLISKINLQSSMQIAKKSVAKGDFEFNPFKHGLTDTALLTLNTVLLNTFSFNRFSSFWGFDISNLQNSGKSLLTYGYESRKLNDWVFKIRVNLSRSITFDINTKKEINSLSSANPQFANRNYKINEYLTEPRLTFIRGTSFRFITSYSYDNKKNDTAFNGGQKAISNALNFETKYNILRSASIGAKFTFNTIDFKTIHPSNGANSTVGYIMLNGLLPGKNYLWNLNFTKTLLNNLELRFEYEGRKPGDARTVHRGTASLNALF
jgi:hypothetical protein